MPDGFFSKGQARGAVIRAGILAICGLLVVLILLRWWMRKSQTRREPAGFRIG